jgi:hypothetical protein
MLLSRFAAPSGLIELSARERQQIPTLYLVSGRKLRPMRARQTAPYQGPGFAKTDIKLGSSRPFS